MGTRVTKNSTPVPVNIVGGSAFGLHPKINNEHTWNMYISEGGSKKEDVFLIDFPGYRKYLEILPEGECRGGFVSIRGNFLIVVINQFVYKIMPNKQRINIGSLVTYTGEVTIAENLAQQICIADGTRAYIYFYGSPGGTVQLLTLDSNLVPNYVRYHNTFFLFGNNIKTSVGSTWYVYSPNPPNSLTLSKVLALQTQSDFALAVQPIPSQANNVMVFGSTTTEIWTQTGSLQFYIRNPTRNVDYGCLSVSTIADHDEYLVWLGRNADSTPVIISYDGQNTIRISSSGINNKLRQIKFPEQSTAMIYRLDDGHLVYHLTFYNQVDNWSLLYDFETKQFSELTDQNFDCHPARDIFYFNGVRLFPSIKNGSIYQMDSGFSTINENEIGDKTIDLRKIHQVPRERITSSIRQSKAERFRANNLSMTLEQGCDPSYQEATLPDYIITEDGTIITTEGGNPLITQDSPYGIYYEARPIPCIDLAVSRDGGVTWSNYDRRKLHPLGKRQNELHWESMGIFNDLQFKFRFISNARWIVNNGVVDIVTA